MPHLRNQSARGAHVGTVMPTRGDGRVVRFRRGAHAERLHPRQQLECGLFVTALVACSDGGCVGLADLRLADARRMLLVHPYLHHAHELQCFPRAARLLRTAGKRIQEGARIQLCTLRQQLLQRTQPGRAGGVAQRSVRARRPHQCPCRARRQAAGSLLGASPADGSLELRPKRLRELRASGRPRSGAYHGCETLLVGLQPRLLHAQEQAAADQGQQVV